MDWSPSEDTSKVFLHQGVGQRTMFQTGTAGKRVTVFSNMCRLKPTQQALVWKYLEMMETKNWSHGQRFYQKVMTPMTGKQKDTKRLINWQISWKCKQWVITPRIPPALPAPMCFFIQVSRQQSHCSMIQPWMVHSRLYVQAILAISGFYLQVQIE